MIRHLSQTLFLVILLALSAAAQARWANVDDAEVEMLSGITQISINADGTYDTIYEAKIKILNERGRDTYAKFPLIYNYDNSTLQVLFAKTINGDQEFSLSSNLIEDKPLASAVHGFDQQHQVMLAFPQVKVGSILYLKYKMHVSKPDIPGYCEFFNEYNKYYFVNDYTIIKSALPLFVNSNNPNNDLSIKSGRDGKLYTVEIKVQKPFYIRIVDETSQLINPEHYPWVFVNTSDNVKDFNNKFAAPYIKVAQQPLPELYQHIADAAAKISDPMQRITFVGAKLNEAVQYMGDWKTAQGRHVPHDLQDVAQTRLGDCKDFATGMVAILNKLGMQANVALVERGEGIYPTSYIKLPGSVHYNHAIVHVMVGKQVLWVDPTNFFSIADKILPDIAAREAIVLAQDNTRIEKIPASNPEDQMFITTREVDLSNPDLAIVNGSIDMRGLAALNFTGAGLKVSKSTIENAVVYELGNYDNIVDKKVEAPALDTRIAADLLFKFSYKEKNLLLQTNAGNAVTVANPLAANFIFNDEQVSDIYLGAPVTVKKITILKNINPVNRLPLDSAVASPWVDATRKVQYGQDSVTIEQSFVVKVSWLLDETIKSEAYQAFVSKLSKEFKDGIAIVFER